MKLTPILTALLAAAAFAGNAAAHEACEHGNGPGHGAMHGDPAKMAAVHARHQQRLHDALKLTPPQEAAWKTFTDKTKPDPEKRKAMHEEMAKLTTPERLDRMQALMKDGEARMAQRAAAVKEFYAQLTPEQQKTFDDQHKAMHEGRQAKRGPAPAK